MLAHTLHAIYCCAWQNAHPRHPSMQSMHARRLQWLLQTAPLPTRLQWLYSLGCGRQRYCLTQGLWAPALAPDCADRLVCVGVDTGRLVTGAHHSDQASRSWCRVPSLVLHIVLNHIAIILSRRGGSCCADGSCTGATMQQNTCQSHPTAPTSFVWVSTIREKAAAGISPYLSQ